MSQFPSEFLADHATLTFSRLFALEGTLTGLLGIASYFYLPPSPYQTASRFRGKSWFTEREEKIMANRILRDDPGKGGMNNRYVSNLPMSDYTSLRSLTGKACRLKRFETASRTTTCGRFIFSDSPGSFQLFP